MKNNKECRYCTDGKSLKSKNAKPFVGVYLNDKDGTIVVAKARKNTKTLYSKFSINFCPQCGRKFDNKAEKD